MKKKVIIVWLLAVIMVLSMVGCSNTPNVPVETTPAEANESYKLEFERKGTYNMPGFGEEFFIHRFDAPNNTIVVYEISECIYLLGEDDGEKGASYCSLVMEECEFIALSDQYLLFENEDGKIAVALEERENVEIGESIYQMYLFDELADEEKEAFIYPVVCERVTQ